MRHYLILGLFGTFVASATVFVFSVVQLARMRYERSHGRRRHRSRLSRLRAHLYASESLRRAART